MMKQKFYTHLVPVDRLIIKLDKLNLSGDEKEHLITIVNSSVHAVVIDIILSEMEDKDKKIFLNFSQDDKHDLIWEFLHKRIENIEEKISSSAEKILKDFEEDINDLLKK